jgi:hypothetical protein
MSKILFFLFLSFFRGIAITCVGHVYTHLQSPGNSWYPIWWSHALAAICDTPLIIVDGHRRYNNDLIEQLVLRTSAADLFQNFASFIETKIHLIIQQIHLWILYPEPVDPIYTFTHGLPKIHFYTICLYFRISPHGLRPSTFLQLNFCVNV